MTATLTSPEVVSAQQVAAACEKGAVDLVDVRTPGEFAAVHATAARLVPLDRLNPAVLTKTRQGGAATPIYLICKSGQRATMAANRFIAAGFDNVAVVRGGTDGWVAAGLPVVRGRGVISLERQVRIAAGALALTGGILAVTIHIGFVVIPAFIGAGLMFAGITDRCGMALLLARMPWNQGMTPTCQDQVKP